MDTSHLAELCHEVADYAVNPTGYADDAAESERRSVRRDHLEALLYAVATGTGTKLAHGQDELDKRTKIGHACIRQAQPGVSRLDEDYETAAKDAVSDILTTLFGPFGYYNGTEATEIRLDPDAGDKAQFFLDSALVSWRGDAEDYVLEGGEGVA